MTLNLNKNRMIAIFWWLVAFWVMCFYIKSCSSNLSINSILALASINIACIAGCSYFIKGYLIPRFLYKNKKLLFILLLLLLILVFANVLTLLHGYYIVLIRNYEWAIALEKVYVFYYQLYDVYVVVMFGCVFVIATQLMVDQLTSQSKYTQLQKENAQTELQFLKAQLNPHFLFNSINSIFANIDKHNVEARDIVLKFSDMLRYQLYECNVDKIDFEQELSYIHNFIALQRLRKEENFSISLESDPKMGNFKIAPLLLIPFIENAFKYASNFDDQKNMVVIKITRDSKWFHFYCMNTRDKMVSNDVFQDGGIGLTNVKRRLELLYPGAHSLEIKNNELTYEVNLKIEIE